MTIVWYHDDATRDDYFVEMDANGALTGQRHRCPNYHRPQPTISTSTTEAAANPSNISTVEQTVIQILQIVQKIERILSDATTPQT